ncbi:MAG: hypothetical protein HN411_00535 [Waddliaceae bacterium]|jgi:endonuclease/exonuclease/phosphatase family metal-dependent hydrolase|nr:hypothetical protein [Waddliaceae bacterium]MBT3579470.1 hypothetical protein [Waddliaceae bacterium]MBT4445581.1 hypothetical protein [Waddliaceae bacterium]MBT6928227.1 hypothetical protein [Waddliaceae bacterium]MBT7264572.1 hypothetical protein [Waddliaceae bacterium]
MIYVIVVIAIALSLAAFAIRKKRVSVEGSIMPQFERVQKGNVPIGKLTRTQLDEINRMIIHKDEKLRVITYNMLFNICEDTLDKAHHWKKRYHRVAKIVDVINPDIIGSQEIFQGQADDLMALIGDTYAFYGRDSHDGLNEGMVNGVFYKKSRYDLLEGKVIFISKTPDIPSRDPYDQMQFLTVCKFRDIKTKKILVIINTHLAFYSTDSREYSAHFISDFIESFPHEEPIILTGDFNSFPFRPDIESLPFYDGDLIDRIITRKTMKDAMKVAKFGHVGPISTFTSEEKDKTVIPFRGIGTPGVILDHIYINNKVEVIAHAVEPAKVGGHFPSDHMPVIADVYIP